MLKGLLLRRVHGNNASIVLCSTYSTLRARPFLSVDRGADDPGRGFSLLSLIADDEQC